MTTISNETLSTRRHMEAVDPPAWVLDLLGHQPPELNGAVRSVSSGDFSLVSGTVARAEALSALELQRAVCSLYLDLWKAASVLPARHPVRFWNFIPGIHARMGGGDGGFLDRYMVFNAGRFAAYAEWYGEADMGPRVATATGIGHSGLDLVVHCLLSRNPGTPIENPRQVPSYRYSRRRGPMPPIFARATVVGMGPARMLLVGGTSSVCGESSVHLGDVGEQILETFHNLACLVDPEARSLDVASRPDDLREVLAAYQTLRVYFVRPADEPIARDLVRDYFHQLKALELCRADVCRRTLLVEIEGTCTA